MANPESFLHRWSRLKSQEGTSHGDRIAGAAGNSTPGSDVCSAELSKLDPGSDFTIYLRDDVPAAVHTAAMRRLWLSTPIFGATDGLDVYRGDYTGRSQEGVVEVARTGEDEGTAAPVPGNMKA